MLASVHSSHTSRKIGASWDRPLANPIIYITAWAIYHASYFAQICVMNHAFLVAEQIKFDPVVSAAPTEYRLSRT